MNAKPHCLRGRYRILKHLTRGGTAEILLAEDLEKPSTKVAIKTLRKEFSYDGAFIRMLRSEFDTLSELSHPNIIAAHEYFSEGNNHYLVLEFVDGWNLQDILFFLRKTQSLLPVAVSVGIAIQIADAVGHIHSAMNADGLTRELLHTDLNPRNVLITRLGRVKLIDFSAAQAEESKAVGIGLARGMISYMSPEQINKEKLDVRTDVFCLGLLLYEMLVGREAFEGKSPAEVYLRLMNDPITPKNLTENLDSKLKDIVCRALNKNPQDRPTGMEEFQRQLESYLSDKNLSFYEQEFIEATKYLPSH